MNASSSQLARKEEEFTRMNSQKTELEAGVVKAKQSEAELRSSISVLRTKLEEENRLQENEKVLFAIDSNIEKWQLGKATELLKSEEEKTKLQTELKSLERFITTTRKEIENLSRKLRKIETEMETLKMEIVTSRTTTEEMKHAYDPVAKEKESLLEIIESGKSELESMVVEYQQQIFAADLADAEREIVEGDALVELGRAEELRGKKLAVAEEVAKLLGETSLCFVSKKIEEELRGVEAEVMEAKSLLNGENSCQV